MVTFIAVPADKCAVTIPESDIFCDTGKALVLIFIIYKAVGY
jgi:hypothetical protein